MPEIKLSVSHLRAIGFAVTGFTLWVLSDALMKLASEANLPFYEIAGFLGFTGVAFLLSKHGVQGNLQTLWPKRPREQLGRAILSCGSAFFNAIALKHLPLALFYITVFTAPMMIALLAMFFLHEKIKLSKAIAITVGFIGVVIAISPFDHTLEGDWIGYSCALASTFCFAGSTTWTRRISQSETTTSLAFSTACAEMVFGFAATLFHAVAVTPYLLLILLGMGVLCVVGNIAVYNGLKHAPAATIAPFHYTQIVVGSLLGYLIWSDVPGLHLLAGALVIIGTGIFIARQARRTEALATIGPP